MYQSNARLVDGLNWPSTNVLFGEADGTGTDLLPSVARHIAISEALERWAFCATFRSPNAREFGFDIDPSSNGMSAFPGIGKRRARRKAMLEAIERFCLISWWEGRTRGEHYDTDWPKVSAIRIKGPFGGVTVIAYSRTDYGMHAYGHAAEESFGAACEKAIIELARHESVLRSWWLNKLARVSQMPTGLFERRCLFFSTEAGQAVFRDRLLREQHDEAAAVDVICDREIPGSWSDYATVWRFALRPPSQAYLTAGEDYFFW